MFRTVGLHGGETTKHKKRESRRKGDFRLICPKSIQPKSKRSGPNSDPAATTATDDVIARHAKANVVVEPKLEMPAAVEPAMIPCN